VAAAWEPSRPPTRDAGRVAAAQRAPGHPHQKIEELATALVLWRRQEHRSGTGPRSRNLLAATCSCGRRIRAAKATLAEAPILCGACQHPFQPRRPDKDCN
jgi:hypothetical protein